MEFINTFDGALEFSIELAAQLETIGGMHKTCSMGYLRSGKTMIRIKDHCPNYFRLSSEIEDGKIERIIDVRVGNKATRKFSESEKEDLLAEYPGCLTEIVVAEYQTISEVVALVAAAA